MPNLSLLFPTLRISLPTWTDGNAISDWRLESVPSVMAPSANPTHGSKPTSARRRHIWISTRGSDPLSDEEEPRNSTRDRTRIRDFGSAEERGAGAKVRRCKSQFLRSRLAVGRSSSARDRDEGRRAAGAARRGGFLVDTQECIFRRIASRRSARAGAGRDQDAQSCTSTEQIRTDKERRTSR